MRSALLLLSLLLCTVAVLAVKDDVACVVHSDDCGRCVSNGCNWCSDGYCVSKESDICEAHKVASQCSVQPVVQQRQLGRQANTACEGIIDCDVCSATSGCVVCLDDALDFKCSGASTCIASPYNLNYELWIKTAKIENNTFSSNNCPAPLTASPTSPTIKLKFKVTLIVPVPGRLPYAMVKALIVGYLRKLLGNAFTAKFVIIVGITYNPPLSKRQNLDTTTHDATVLVKFADAEPFTAQGIAATLLSGTGFASFSGTSETPGLSDDSLPITAQPYTPTTGTSGIISTGNVVNRNGGSGLHLSKGALAGIIIGCVIGGALIVALIAFLILRRRDSYPQAFRSPAAAYRP